MDILLPHLNNHDIYCGIVLGKKRVPALYTTGEITLRKRLRIINNDTTREFYNRDKIELVDYIS